MLKLSVITIAYNSEDTIEDTLISVLSQNYENIEYIVIDGASSDGTLEICEKYSDRLILVSERDTGIYNAMNKGLNMATGDVIAILNSDDIFASTEVLSFVADKFLEKVDFLSTSIEYRSSKGKLSREWKVVNRDLTKRNQIPHPGLFVRKTVYDEIGCYNERYNIAADYDFIQRLFESDFIGIVDSRVTVLMRDDGVSGSFKGRIKGLRELLMIRRNHNLNGSVVFVLSRYMHRIINVLKS